ncbi:OsmC family protein [Abyssalbus ytuae]|uniref:OsmC family protein n=1 Tax=Abyssalbus ytuae TaxID=2926907 RepID=A0A9E7D2T5_9FLAO|nr:OsmC family protein [Abyssalbus ytuae]UOB17049.1 OsmC family protein [Abyssalbus ytuae]
MNREHNYSLTVHWTGNSGKGTSGYKEFERSHVISTTNKPDILGSSDPAFRGDPFKYNPEELLIASISACHMLWYLHLCSEAGIIITGYSDKPTGIMIETKDGNGRFKEVSLNPAITISESSMIPKASKLHQRANELCFIANSLTFKVYHNPDFIVEK